MEDIETAHSSVEELAPLVRQSRKKMRKRQHLRFLKNLALQAQLEVMRRHNRVKEPNSLPASPFLTERKLTSYWPCNQNCAPNKLITAAQVKKALAIKSKRYRKGIFKPLGGRPHPPVSTPTLFHMDRRKSKSLSDILTLLWQPGETSKSMVKSHYSPYMNGFGLRKPLHHSVQRLSKANSPNILRRSDSQDTLKPTGSISEFSAASGDPELEFDLYDYNLDNVVAGHPDSLFAPAQLQTFYWAPEDELPTPTVEEFPMTELFPSQNDKVILRRPDQDSENRMQQSRTSDLTASVTSADLGQNNGGNYQYYDFYGGRAGEDEEEEDEPRETDKLLSRQNGKATILNLTHIDDDISFADSDDNAPMHNEVNTFSTFLRR